MSSSTSLKASQLAAVRRMLAFNSSSDDDANLSGSSSDILGVETSRPPSWKILIYDLPCRSIISPLLSVSQLRASGVTLHLLLSSNREPIPDVPAIYFCEPTRSNLSMIAQDCVKGLYKCAYLNFVTKLPRYLMEEFAKLIVQTNSLPKVVSIHDQYLDYVCLEKGLFSLYKKKSYARYNEAGVTEETVENAMEEAAYGLFSVVATLGVVPIIRCPKGGAPEMVARKLHTMITSHPTLSRGKTLQYHRPLLVVLDRSADLATPIQHSSTYQALIDDLLTHSANRVEFTVQPDKNEDERSRRRQKPQIKKYDLDADEDSFYSKHKFSPFPEAVESNALELQDVSERESQVRSTTTSEQNSNFNSMPNESNPSDLASAVDSLPKLLERKKQLEVHTSILQAVMNQVAERDVPLFYELENSLATGVYKNDFTKAKAEVMELIKDPKKGNIDDKIRLLAVYCLNTGAPSSDIDEIANILKQSAITANGGNAINSDSVKKLETGFKSIAYLKRLRSLHNMIPSVVESTEINVSTGGSSGDMLSSLMRSAQTQATGLLARATEKVSGMFGKMHKHYATRVVENLCEFKVSSEDETFLYLDPKKTRGEVDIYQIQKGGVARGQIKEVIVFMVGGGCYAEYQNLQMLSNKNTNNISGIGDGRKVTYGCTELVNPTEFLGQLSELE